MAKKKRKTSRVKRTAAATTFTGTARITGYVTSNLQDIAISPKTGNKRRHAIFSFTAVSPTFAARFAKMAAASTSPASYTYSLEPSLLQVARDFVTNELGAGWSVAADGIGSCWTPTGWQQPAGNDRCESFGLLAGGSEVTLPLSRDESPKGLRLRFAVSVEVTP
jgi:hypothetical protein